MGKITNNELASDYKARVIRTSLTRPSNPTNGLEIYETDTTNNYTWNGSIWENKLDVHKADYTHHYKKDAGTTDAYVVALSPAITSYIEGMTLDIFCKTANTGAATLDAGGGAKDLRKYYNDALETGDIEAGAIITVKWDSANDWWQVTSGIKVTVVDGTTVVKGIVQLSTSTSSTSTTLAATPSAVKSAYDLANSASKIVSGSYAGNGDTDRTITVGFTPKVVFISNLACASDEQTPQMEIIMYDNTANSLGDKNLSAYYAIAVSQQYSGTNQNFAGQSKITTNGFLVTGYSAYNTGMNSNSNSYGWVAIG